jgi:hypothetical protein
MFVAAKSGLRVLRGLALVDATTNSLFDLTLPEVFVHRAQSA